MPVNILKHILDNDADEFDLIRTVKQLGSGFLSGLTTFNVGDDPENVIESIARSVGGLIGFLGVIPGPGLAGKLAVSSIGRAMRLHKLFGGARGAAQLAAGPNVLRGMSIPLKVAEKVVQRIEGPADAAGTVWKFLNNTRSGDVVREGLKLGTASAVGSWQQGIDEMISAFTRGSIEGVGFRALANFSPKVLGELMKSSEESTRVGAGMALRGIASSLYSGGLSSMRGEPLEMQIYEYLLGAYFGVVEKPFYMERAQRFVRDEIQRPYWQASARPWYPWLPVSVYCGTFTR